MSERVRERERERRERERERERERGEGRKGVGSRETNNHIDLKCLDRSMDRQASLSRFVF